ncbi:MAG: hypothetical protein AAGN66_05545 [Acidobacteriota bacterium]
MPPDFYDQVEFLLSEVARDLPDSQEVGSLGVPSGASAWIELGGRRFTGSGFGLVIASPCGRKWVQAQISFGIGASCFLELETLLEGTDEWFQGQTVWAQAPVWHQAGLNVCRWQTTLSVWDGSAETGVLSAHCFGGSPWVETPETEGAASP